MATLIKRQSSAGVTAATRVGAYTAPAATTGVYVTGLVIANNAAGNVSVTCWVQDGSSNQFKLCTNAFIPPGGSIMLASSGNRLALNSGDGVFVLSTGLVDVNMSVSEIS